MMRGAGWKSFNAEGAEGAANAEGAEGIENPEALVKFGALIAAYNGDALTASAAWEKLGQIDLAVQQARAGGDLERAYGLLRRHGRPVPEELATAVKLVRQAQQLGTKGRQLTPAEREALAAQLRALAEQLGE